MKAKQEWLTNCEAEPLAFSGAIQAHGGLLHVNKAKLVSHVSAKIEHFLPHTPAELLGRPLPEELALCLEPSLANLALEPGSRKELYAVNLPNSPCLDIVISRGSDGIVIELTAHLPAQTVQAYPLAQIQAPQNSGQVLAMHNEMASFIHELTGFNRVMIYAFREDGDGEVLAEARHANIYGSYLGLRFPGSDIPHIARALYLKNPWRLIPNNQAPATPLLSRQESPPNLTWSDLRSVSLVHQAYLANMGVSASLSFPIRAVGELSGLIACHHAEPRNLPLEILHIASIAAQNYSLKLLTWQAQERVRFTDKLSNYFTSLRMILQRYGDMLDATAEISLSLLTQFDACGLAVRFDDEWAEMGEVPDFEELEQLDNWFTSVSRDMIYSTDSLGRSHPDLNLYPASGGLGIKLNTRSKQCLHLWLFRQEFLHTIEWGGNPDKPIENIGEVLDIAPRRSFEKFIEKRLGFSNPWKNEHRLKAMRLRQLLLELYG